MKFKNTHETAQAMKGLTLVNAKAYLENVMEKKDIVPFRRYRYGVGRKAQCKKYKVSNEMMRHDGKELALKMENG